MKRAGPNNRPMKRAGPNRLYVSLDLESAGVHQYMTIVVSLS